MESLTAETEWNRLFRFERGENAKKLMNNAEKYEEKYLPQCWKDITEEQIKSGHGGMDGFLFRAFVDAAKSGSPMPIDVYDAAAWMSITYLSEKIHRARRRACGYSRFHQRKVDLRRRP